MRIVVEKEIIEGRKLGKDAATASPTNLITIDSGDPRWTVIAAEEIVDVTKGEMVGAIVRITPPPSATKEHVSLLERACKLLGAQAVKVLPRQHGSIVPKSAEKKVRGSRREIVLKLAGESKVMNRDAVCRLLTKVMDAVGI